MNGINKSHLVNKRKNGNRFTSKGRCQTDIMMEFILLWGNDFNARLIARRCNVKISRASDFLRVLYKNSKTDKTGEPLKNGMISYKLRISLS